MAMKQITASDLVHTDSTDSSWTYTTYAAHYAGFAGSGLYCVYILRFYVPAFSGVSEGLTAGLYMSSGMGSNVTLRYALCTSDANRNKYLSTTAAVTDTNQIATGTVSISNVTSDVAKKEINFKTGNIKGGRTYYLILWAAGDTGVSIKQFNSAWGNHSVTVGYNIGVVRLKVNGQVKSYMVFVKVSGALKQMIPYVKTASGIKPGG